MAMAARAKTGTFPVAILPPLTALPVAGAYQADMGWGTKAQRVRKQFHHIMDHEEDYHWWFVSPENDKNLKQEEK